MAISRTCPRSGEVFDITDEDLAYYASHGPIVRDVLYPLPPPLYSPRERLIQRLAFRQERALYRRTCCVTGKTIVTIYSPDKPLKVVDKSAWLDLDNREFGREFDFSRPFFEQFHDLSKETYKASIVQSGEIENSDYAHFVGRIKNGYLTFDSGSGEDMYYSVLVGWGKYYVDCYLGVEGQHCYECVKFENCYECFFCTRTKSSSFSAFLYDCIGCKNCIGCVNLRNKEWHVFNKYVGREQYEKLWRSIFCGSYRALTEFAERFYAFRITQPHRAFTQILCNNVTGDDLTQCENVYESYNCHEVRNSKFLHDCYFEVTHCYDITGWGEGMERCAELTGCGGLKGKTGFVNSYFGACLFYGGYDLVYSMHCYEKSQNLFGCTDLRKAQYCILNKQYTKEEYETLVPKIIAHMHATGEWGRYFPYALSPFGYNESLAFEEEPLTQEEAVRRGARWSESHESESSVTEGILARDLPDKIPEVGDPILKSPIFCEVSGRPFRVIAKEVEFYRTHGLPLPRASFQERHRRRRNRLTPRKLWTRRCAMSGEEIVTTFSPERPEIVVSLAEFEKVKN